jgi:nitroreductase
MDWFELLRSRHSVRVFGQTPVDREKLQRILEACNQAPSAGNLQAFQVYVTEVLSVRQSLARAAWGQDFIASAPLVLVFCSDPDRSATRYRDRGRTLYAVQDATIACTYAMLAASALGLASVWVGAFDDRAVKRIIQAPGGQIPVSILPVGYAAEHPAATPRRPLEELVHRIEAPGNHTVPP